MKKKVLVALGLGVAAVAAVVAYLKLDTFPEDDDLWDLDDEDDDDDDDEEFFDESYMDEIDAEDEAAEVKAASSTETPEEVVEEATI